MRPDMKKGLLTKITKKNHSRWRGKEWRGVAITNQIVKKKPETRDMTKNKAKTKKKHSQAK